MGTFKVVRRNNRTKEDHLYEDIERIVNDSEAIFYDGYCLPDDVNSIYAAMNMVDNYYNRAYGVRCIGLEIEVNEIEQMEAYNIFQQLLQWIGQEFYTIGTVSEADGDGYRIRLLIHTTSYRTGRKFHDNNDSLLQIVQFLKEITHQDFKISNGTYFTGTSEDQGCFI